MESVPITRVSIEALHDRQDLHLELRPGLNILYGKNGTGKTTFLHVLANLLDRDVARFTLLRFARIIVETKRGSIIEVVQERGDDSTRVVVSINDHLFPPVGRGEQTPPDLREELRKHLGGRPVYLPAFRSVLEAISRTQSSHTYLTEEQREGEYKQIVEREQEESTEKSRRLRLGYFLHETTRAVAYKTVLCREWFGPFVPIVRFPSLWEVSEELFHELHQAQLDVAATDRQAFSGVFVDVLKTVLAPEGGSGSGDVTSLLSSIRDNLTALEETQTEMPTVYGEIASMVHDHDKHLSREETSSATGILKVYEQALQERIKAQKKAFQQIRTFESSVNRFLTDKTLAVRGGEAPRIARRGHRARVITLADGRSAGLSVLSSGERHVLTLLFSATHMSITDGMLLIDEPELSLHVGWQRIILDELIKQAGNRQIVACTHAPEVAAGHHDMMIELAPQPSQHAEVTDDPDLDDYTSLID